MISINTQVIKDRIEALKNGGMLENDYIKLMCIDAELSALQTILEAINES